MASPKRKSAAQASLKKIDDEQDPASGAAPKLSAARIEAWAAWVAKGPQGPIEDAT